MNRYMTLGLLAGATVFEAALLPTAVIGAAATLAPKYVPKLRRTLQSLSGTAAPRRTTPKPRASPRPNIQVPAVIPADFAIKEAIAKTVTFRIIVTTLDFTANYIIIGEVATAAGLSAFALVAGPLFYFAHEIAWHRYNPAQSDIDLGPVFGKLSAQASQAGPKQILISRALAKTITFRTVATIMDFSATYFVVGDLATAVGLSAFGFVLGPFVYLGHEKLWDYYTSGKSAGNRSAAPDPRVKAIPSIARLVAPHDQHAI